MMNYKIFQNDSSSKIFLLAAAFVILTLSTTMAHGADCSAVDFSVVFKSVLIAIPTQDGNNIAEADFNRDGNLDFAVSNTSVGTVNVYLGNGKGNFTVSTLTSAVFPRRIFARDFNRDGKMDLLVSSNVVTLFNGDGNGGFTLGGTFSASFFGRAITVADFNLDGKEDFVVKDNSGINHIFFMFLGNGNGTFASPISIPLTTNNGADVASALAADFNRDGKPDLVLGSLTSNQVFFLPGNGAGGFGTMISFNVGFTDTSFLTTEDLNGDGRLDLITSGNPNNFRILLGAATGVFTLSTVITAAAAIRSIRTADFNNDGKVDLLIQRDARIEARLGNGDGTFAASVLTTATGDGEFVARDVIAADFNNDGKIDFVSTDASEVFVGLNRCGGLTAKPKIDFDGDGKTDSVVFRPSTGQWFALRSSNNSFFAFPFGANGDIPAAGDFDGDGRTDAAVFRPSTGQWFVLNTVNNSVTTLQFGQTGDRPAVGDYDGDGKADIAVFRPSNGLWFVLRSTDGGATIFQWGISTDIVVQ